MSYLLIYYFACIVKIPVIPHYRTKTLMICLKTLGNQSILDISCLQTFSKSVLFFTGSYGEAHRNNIIKNFVYRVCPHRFAKSIRNFVKCCISYMSSSAFSIVGNHIYSVAVNFHSSEVHLQIFCSVVGTQRRWHWYSTTLYYNLCWEHLL